MTVAIIFVTLVNESVCRAIGFSSRGSLAQVIHNSAARPYADSGILGGWRNSVSASETAVVLVLIILLRVGATIFEDKLGAGRYSKRPQLVKKYLSLLYREGPCQHRVMCYALVVACLFMMPTELAWYGKDMAAMREAADDDEA